MRVHDGRSGNAIRSLRPGIRSEAKWIVFTIANLCALIGFTTLCFSEQSNRQRVTLNEGEASAKIQDPALSQELAVLNERVRSQDQRIKDSIELVAGMAKNAAAVQSKTIDDIEKLAFRIAGVLGVVGSILTIFGITGLKKLNDWRHQAKNNLKSTEEAANSIRRMEMDARGKVEELDGSINKNRIDLRALEAVTRVMPRIGRSDLANDSADRQRLASEALLELNEAQRLNSALSASLLLEKAKALKRLDRYVEAFVVATEAAELAKKEQNKYDEARSYYNAGCYLALSGGVQEKETALSYLVKASSISPTFKTFATKDKDLESLRHDQRFKELLSS
jgi:hypothetical protein